MILYFSGTGNSHWVAKEIAQHTDQPLVSLGERLQQRSSEPLHSTNPFVFVLPTYCWRIPKVIEEHIMNTPFTGSTSAYFVLTCGGSTYGAVDYIEKLCAKKGFQLLGFREIVMPENYIAMFQTPTETEAKKIIAAAAPLVAQTAQDIHSGAPFPPFHPTGRFFSHVINPIFYKFFVSDKGFYTTDDCIACGKCVLRCPLKNITLEDRPLWQGHCTHCMACIATCPTQAIEYKRKSHGKPRYYLPSGDSPLTP